MEEHTWIGLGLVLSFDGALLANTSSGKTINSSPRESTSDLTTLSSSHQLDYSPNWNSKIHIYDIPSDILTSVWPTQKEHCLLHVGGPQLSCTTLLIPLLQSGAMCRALHHNYIRITPIEPISHRIILDFRSNHFKVRLHNSSAWQPVSPRLLPMFLSRGANRFLSL